MKYYFRHKDSERCYTKDDLFDLFWSDEDITEMQVYPAKMMIGEPFAFCSEFGESIETRTGDCGKFCDKYSPRNGKNGRCRFSYNCYEPADEPIILKL